jgi:hypothetical protein
MVEKHPDDYERHCKRLDRLWYLGEDDNPDDDGCGWKQRREQ